jgi:hypothetical protein
MRVAHRVDFIAGSFHPPLVYGRRGDPSLEEGEGVAVCKVAQSSRTLFCLITYVYPTLSARAVPQLKEFCETQREWRWREEALVGRRADVAYCVLRIAIVIVVAKLS